MLKYRKADEEPTLLAQAAVIFGPTYHGRPAYDTSPHGYAFRAGLWARENRVEVAECHISRGHSVILNRRYKIDFAKGEPAVSHVN